MEISALRPQAIPAGLYTAAQVRELDRLAIEDRGVPGIRLMKRAGRATFDALLARWPEPGKITVLCGVGNNAGDGYVIAGLAAQRRMVVEVLQVGDAGKLQGDALAAYQYARQEGVIMQPWHDSLALEEGVLVDALLGTGLKGEVREDYAAVIERINASGLPVVAVDIPSGLCADSGRVLGRAVRARLTVSFIGIKRGLLTGRGPACSGELVFDDLRVPGDIYREFAASAQLLRLSELLATLPTREADAHKGSFGHVMVIGGDLGYGGAAMMAAEAAARVGAGLVSVATRPEHLPAILARRPELMAAGVTSGQELEPLLQRPSVLVVGPGLGRSPWSEQMLHQAVNSGLPLVLDADALNILGEGRVVSRTCRDDWVLTPHPGEAARLLGVSTAEIQADRFAAITRLQEKFGGTVVLKGAGSLVQGPSREIGLSTDGNPGMASGGMGDVLSGILGGLLAQILAAGGSAESATRLGVCLHGAGADLAADDGGQRGLLATDVIPCARELLNACKGEG